MRKREPQELSNILVRVAKKTGVRINLEPRFRFVGQIAFAGGRYGYFRNTNFDLNPLGAAEIAKDKDYAAYFLRRFGYPVVEGEAFFSRRWCQSIGSARTVQAAYCYARRLGFPVLLKPNSKSQGTGVCVVTDRSEFFRVAREIFKQDNVLLVQRYVRGKDYRLVVLDKTVISAYERIPLSVTGDGRSSIRQLLARKQRQFVRQGRDTVLDPDDWRITMRLSRMKKNRGSLLRRGEQLTLLDSANLSTGGDAVDVTRRIHPAFRSLAIRLTRDMGLRFCGVDLIVVTGTIQKQPRNFCLIEINAAPGLDNYSAIGKQQAAVVENLYRKVLVAMKRRRS